MSRIILPDDLVVKSASNIGLSDLIEKVRTSIFPDDEHILNVLRKNDARAEQLFSNPVLTQLVLSAYARRVGLNCELALDIGESRELTDEDYKDDLVAVKNYALSALLWIWQSHCSGTPMGFFHQQFPWPASSSPESMNYFCQALVSILDHEAALEFAVLINDQLRFFLYESGEIDVCVGTDSTGDYIVRIYKSDESYYLCKLYDELAPV
jgi:hypothetical protein